MLNLLQSNLARGCIINIIIVLLYVAGVMFVVM